jgi:hypothetical protein
MNRIPINSIIAEYLASNRRLVVPNFGAFIVKESGEVVFSELLRTDDGVLTSLLLARGLSEMEAAVTIDRYKFNINHELHEYGYCQLDELGTLRAEGDDKKLKLYQLQPLVRSIDAVDEIVPEVEIPHDTTTSTPEVATPATEEVESAEKEGTDTTTTDAIPKKPYVAPKRKRGGVDFIIVVAIVIVLGAIVAIGYGVYVSVGQ